MQNVIEVWGSSNVGYVNPGAGLERRIAWDGGRGWLVVQGFNSPGVQINSEIMVHLDLSTVPTISPLPDLGPITASGTYPFEAPKGDLRFGINLSSGDNVAWDAVFIIKV
ncbi:MULTISPECIES: hypothetical protein [Rhodomicrobium]|uniref:hypothetical protein n=1 Tax=Rhodomicrobium TaxID=1068 RepID=UPI000F73E8F5|nr:MULTISPECIES: hypothetical protein [Rhodomicrobium]